MKKLALSVVLCVLLVGGFAQKRYYKTQMHCHTTNSDGGYSPTALAEKYRDAGYEILFITDHNFMTPGNSIQVPGVLCINSEELTFNRHVNGFFLNHTIEAGSFDLQQSMDSIAAHQGFSQINHYRPGLVTEDSWEVHAAEIIALQNGPTMLEIWNTGTETIQTHDDKSVWDSVLTAGKMVYGSATDDFHPSVMESMEFNKGWNMILLDTLSQEAVFDAIASGDFYASTGVEIYTYEVTEYGQSKNIYVDADCDIIQFWGANHTLIQTVQGSSASYFLSTEPFVRCELIKEGFLGIGNKYAWTQPVFRLSTTQSDPLLTNNHGLHVFPNPAEEQVCIQMDCEILSVEMVMPDGRVFNVAPSNYSFISSTSIEMKTDNFNPGMYILKVNSSEGLYSTKLVLR